VNLFETICQLITITCFSYIILIFAVFIHESRQLDRAATQDQKDKILNRWERRRRRRFSFLP
jgi:hypothetical protein